MNNLPREVSKAVMALAMTCGSALPASACGPSFGPAGWTVIMAVIVAIKLTPFLVAGLFLKWAFSVYAVSTKPGPLRGRVTVLSDRALGLRT